MKKPTLLRTFDGKKVPREAPPPSKWGRGKSGIEFTVRKVGFRNRFGKKLYRLGFYATEDGRPLFSSHLWTLDELNAQSVEWLPVCPVAVEVQVDVQDPEAPDLAIEDKEEEAEEPVAEPVVEPPKRRHPPEMMREDPPAAPVAPKVSTLPTTCEERYPFVKVGIICQHSESKKPYRVLGIVDMDTVRVEEVAADGVKRPGRSMRCTKLEKKS